jgi:uncharacterized membrane protein
VIAELVAIASSGVFAGAAIYISAVQQPAVLDLGAETAVQYFRPMYTRAAPMQASLAIVGSLAAFWACWSGGGIHWLVGGALLAFVIPFTLLAILPTNDRLKDPTLDPRSTEARELLAHWANLHAVRTIASTAAFLVFLVAVLSP